MRRWNSKPIALLACASVGVAAVGSLAQDSKPATEVKAGLLPVATQGEQVLVKREAARLTAPDKYKTHLYLEPYHTVVLSAPYDGVVRQVSVKPHAKVQVQTPLVRLDNGVVKLQLQRANANYKASTIEAKLADKGDENKTALAQARLEAAKADVDLATLIEEQATVRAPITGEVLGVMAVEGQFVRAGEPLVKVADLTKLKVALPVERSKAEKDQPLTVKVEAAEVEGKVESILPLEPRFDALRDLFESIATATVVVDNASGKYKPGQTVYASLIPRNVVTEVSSASIGNRPDGQRRVQILRQWVVRDLPVELLGPVGTSRLLVSGAFADGDEVIYETSHQLPDGFQLKPATGEATKTAGGGGQANPGAATPTNVGRPAGF